MTHKTQGLSLFVQKDASTFTKAGKIVDFSNFNGTRSQIDVTDTDDTEEMQYEAGLKQPGAITVNFNGDYTDASQEELEALYDSGVKKVWVIGLSDGTAPPTVALDAVTLPTTRTFIKFEGFIADLNLASAKNDILRGTMQVQRSGKRVISRKA